VIYSLVHSLTAPRRVVVIRLGAMFNVLQLVDWVKQPDCGENTNSTENQNESSTSYGKTGTRLKLINAIILLAVTVIVIMHIV